MPPVKPSDKTGHEGEWWRGDQGEHGPEGNHVDPQHDTHMDEAEMGKNAFDQAQKPVRYPSSG